MYETFLNSKNDNFIIKQIYYIDIHKKRKKNL